MLSEGLKKDVFKKSPKIEKYFPVFELEKILKIKFPKIEVKIIDDITNIEYTPVFRMILNNFNRAHSENLTPDSLLYSRHAFGAFMLFLINCILKRYIIICEESEDNFMQWLENLADKYNQNLRSIDMYYDIIVEKVFFYPRWLTKKDQEVREHMYFFDQAYSLVKVAFKDEEREDWKRYFEHLKWVMDILIWELPGMNLERILIWLLHDIQEDMPEYADSVRVIYGDYIADGVDALSKKPREKYLTDEELNKCWWYLKEREDMLDVARKKIVNRYPDKSFMAPKKIKEKELIKYMDEEELWKYVSIMANLAPFMEQAKERRNQDYFGHLDSLNDDYLSVKLADRIHNLRDVDWLTKERILRKVEETEKYFLDVAQRRNPIAYNLLMIEITKLREKIQNT